MSCKVVRLCREGPTNFSRSVECICNLSSGVFEVGSTSGDTHLGGEDFDQRVMQYFIKSMQKKSNVDISNNKPALQKLRKEVERVKRALSSQHQARLEIDGLAEGYDFSETLTRARFEELNHDLFKKTLAPGKSCVKMRAPRSCSRACLKICGSFVQSSKCSRKLVPQRKKSMPLCL